MFNRILSQYCWTLSFLKLHFPLNVVLYADDNDDKYNNDSYMFALQAEDFVLWFWRVCAVFCFDFWWCFVFFFCFLSNGWSARYDQYSQVNNLSLQMSLCDYRSLGKVLCTSRSSFHLLGNLCVSCKGRNNTNVESSLQRH